MARELWETKMEEELHPSSHQVLQLSVSTTAPASHPPTAAGGTGTFDTDTGTDFGLLESYTKGVSQKRSQHRVRERCRRWFHLFSFQFIVYQKLVEE